MTYPKRDIIEVNVKKLPESCRKLVRDSRALAKKRGFVIHLLNTEFIYCDEENQKFPVEGFIQDLAPKKIVVACGRSIDKWISTLAHEVGHLDQYIEQSPAWTGTSYKGMDLVTRIDDWIDGKCEIKPETLKNYITRIQTLEHDCEIRALEKISEYNLPIDPDLYTQQANAYVWFYTYVRHARVWHKEGKPVYQEKRVYQHMPKQMMELHEYSSMPREIKQAYKSCI